MTTRGWFGNPRIIPPTRLAYVAIAFSRFACFERPGMRFVGNSNIDRSDSVIAFAQAHPDATLRTQRRHETTRARVIAVRRLPG